MKKFIAAILFALYCASGASAQPATCCNFDVDDNGISRAMSDGLLLLRYADGIRGKGLTASAVAQDAARRKPKQIVKYLDLCRTEMADPDGNDRVTKNDAQLIFGYLAGFRGIDLTHPVIDGTVTPLVASDCERCTAEQIMPYLDERKVP